MGGPTQNLGQIGLDVLTFIGQLDKQTERQTDRQANYI